MDNQLRTRGTGGHSRRRIAWRAAAACASAAAIVLVAACSSSSGSASATSSGSASGSASATGANVTAAQAALVPITGHPSAFPVTTPLPEKLPAGKKFVFLQCGTPFCALAGMSLQRGRGGDRRDFHEGGPRVRRRRRRRSPRPARSLLKPDVVFMTVDPSLFGDGLKKLSNAGIKVVSISIAKDVEALRCHVRLHRRDRGPERWKADGGLGDCPQRR